MTQFFDIQKLASEALASVEEEERSKTASDQTETVPALSTEIGRELKKAASLLREAELETVSTQDLMSLVKHASLVGGTVGGVLGSAGGPAGAALGAGAGNALENAFKGSSKAQSGNLQAATQAPVSPMATPKMGSALGNELRSLAENVRTIGKQAEDARLIKAAHMYNAGVALAHLIGEAQ